MATPIVTPIIPITTQELTNSDAVLVSSVAQENFFNPETDVIRTFVYDINNTFLRSININYTVLDTKTEGTNVKEIQIDPAQDLQSNFLTTGTYNVNYNFLKTIVDINSSFYLKEISSDRTELRIDSTTTNDTQKQVIFDSLNTLLNSGESFKGLYLNLNDDKLLLITNVAWDANTILLKLYQPLPSNYNLKQTLNVFEKVSEPLAYQVEWMEEEVAFDDRIFLKGPNFNLTEKSQVNNSSEYKTLNTIYTSSLTNLTSQLGSILAERRAELNTDYTDYTNFVFYSSAQQRLANFYYKASLIEDYNNQITTLNALTLTTEVSSSIAYYQKQINDLIVNFDGYDYFLYFDSGSKSWPKSNSTPPYTLYGTGSANVISWYNAQSTTASLYDDDNANYLYNIYPTYVTEDPDNTQLQLFTEMAAQMFDEIWLYTQALKNRQDGDNSLEGGISKDLVADALRSYGLTLYQSSFTDSDLFTSLLGIDQAGNTLPPTGSELITNYITSSAETTPFDDAQKLIYKRLYHNLPFLLKKKGTVAGLRVLLSCFGIPDTLIRISEFGGKDKINANNWDYWYNKFNYKFTTYPGFPAGYVTAPWSQSNAVYGNDYPNTVEFRFQPTGSVPYSQSLMVVSSSTDNFALVLEYTSSQTTSGSYSGSIADVYNQWATLKFVYDVAGTPVSCSTDMPFYDGNWWSVMLTQEGSNITLYTKNKLYNGDDGSKIGFQASSSLTVGSLTPWQTIGNLYLGGKANTTIAGKTYTQFSGSLQELRYYNTALSQSVFDDYVMNPHSIEGNGINSSKDQLFFRASLGGEMYTGSNSIHPGITGSTPVSSSFDGDHSGFSFGGESSFQYNTEYFFQDQFPAGIRNRITDKIKQSNLILPSTGSGLPTTDVLSSYISVQQEFPVSQSYTADLNLVEVAFSPQNEINDDINNSIGYFNLGDYLNIRTTGSSYYDLNRLRDEYFTKYKASYDYKDYTRLIKYFDNALFKMIKDYVPARTSISTGIVIKQHLLERNKYSEPVVTFTQPEYTSSIEMYTVTGSDGGAFENQTIIQSWSGSFITPSGSVPYIHSSEDEYYNGEFSGSTINIPEPHPCPIDFVGVYYTGSFEVNASVLSTSNLWAKPNYDFDYDKDYFLQFTINNHPDAAGPGTVYILNGDKNTYVYDGPWVSAGGSTNVLVEIKNVVSPLYFLEVDQNILNPASMSISNFTASVFQLEDNDCAPLINNTSTYPLSQYFMKVDYNSGQLVPTNFDALVAGTGTKAAVKDYYYNLRRQTIPRYNGSRLQAYQLNAYTASTDTSYGKSPVIERYSDYFIYFDWIGGSNPEYPGGGNIHGVYLIDIEGKAVALTTDNFNLSRVENIFKQGTTANILPAVYSYGNETIKVDIVDGGALYNTILLKSGSDVPRYQVKWENDPVAVIKTPTFFTSSTPYSTLNDNTQYWLYPLLTGSDVQSGSVEYLRPRRVTTQTLFFYNKKKGDFALTTDANSGITPLSDTYFPIQYGDFIRFGNTGSITDSGSIDGTFSGLDLVTIKDIIIAATSSQTSSILITPSLVSSSVLMGDNNNQNFRIMRRIPNESFVLVKNIPAYTDPGFLIPEDFNPNYDPYELAKKAGVIS